VTESTTRASEGWDSPDQDEVRRFAAAFRSFLEWVHSAAGGVNDRNEVTALVAEALGPDGIARSVVTKDLPPFEHVNLQTAINAWSDVPGRAVDVRGITLPPHFGIVSLHQLASGEAMPPLRLSAPPLTDLPDGPHSTLACLTLALLIVEDVRGRYVLMVTGPSEHFPGLRVEVAGLEVAAAQEVLAELDALRRRLNVYRGHLLDVTMNPMGGVNLVFLDPPGLSRDQVILPEPVMQRIERHAVAIADHREALLRAGQHLKRGLLLFGPPGTGKTHTTRYLVGRMVGSTRLVLTGRMLSAVGLVAELARDLAPSVLVLEDVDLVAEDRTFGMGSNPILFDLLDAMDGAAPDADLLFLLTTNRADLLEPALAARPGRVDIAVEIALPDGDARGRLLDLYGRDVPLRLTHDERREAVERTEGVTASFLKELIRRAVLEALLDDATLPQVTGVHVGRALDDLLDSTQAVTRSLHGVGVDPATLPAGQAGPAGPGVHTASQGVGWYGPVGPRPRRRR
jgi:ATPase family associated with various cellular activities (AAA)